MMLKLGPSIGIKLKNFMLTLHAYLIRHRHDASRLIMGVTWRDKITNVEILTHAGLPSMADILVEKRLK